MARHKLIALTALLVACGSKDSTDTSDTTPGTDTPTVTETGETGETGTPPTDTSPPVVATDYCPALSSATGATVLQPGADIQAALDAATSGDVIALASGTWTVTAPIVLRTAGVTLRGQSGNPADVVLEGDYSVDDLLLVQAADVTIAGLTVQHAGRYGIHVQPSTASISGTTIEHVVSLDHGQVHLQVEADTTRTSFSDGGEIRCSRFELSDAGRDSVIGLCETGGLHLRRAQGWAIRDNTIAGLWCDAGTSGQGIRVQDGTRDVMIERNVLSDVAMGIAVGVTNLPGRTYPDAPCGGATAQAFGVTVQNNTVFAGDGGLLASAAGVVGGIWLESACESTVLHNTVYSGATSQAALSVRYVNTTGVVANNLTNGTVRRLDDAPATLVSNVENTIEATFEHTPSGNVHLSPAAATVIDAADPTYTVADDIDGQPRDAAPDIGADEYYAE